MLRPSRRISRTVQLILSRSEIPALCDLLHLAVSGKGPWSYFILYFFYCYIVNSARPVLTRSGPCARIHFSLLCDDPTPSVVNDRPPTVSSSSTCNVEHGGALTRAPVGAT